MFFGVEIFLMVICLISFKIKATFSSTKGTFGSLLQHCSDTTDSQEKDSVAWAAFKFRKAHNSILTRMFTNGMPTALLPLESTIQTQAHHVLRIFPSRNFNKSLKGLFPFLECVCHVYPLYELKYAECGGGKVFTSVLVTLACIAENKCL